MRTSTALALAIVTGWAGVALLHPLFMEEATAVQLSRLFEPPGAAAWLGTDELGRSIGSRVLAGAAVSCGVGFVVVALSLAIGTVYGVACAYAGGAVDAVGARVIDVFMAFPGILLAIALAGVLGPGAGNVLLALCAVGWVGFARLARAQTLALKHRDHVAVGRALGSSTCFILTRHILPLTAAPLIVEATLSFLGLGAQPPTPTWGGMLATGMQYWDAWWMSLFPGLAIFLSALALNFLGDGLRDAMDSRLQD